jgi:hypothetical protein
MSSSSIVATLSIVAAAIVCAPRTSAAQAPCSTTRAFADSAREEVMTVLTSPGTLGQELRQENGIGDTKALAPEMVHDGLVCSKLATQFGHPIGARTKFVVLRVGPLFYAREPDQRRGTGIITDSTYHVLARLGVAIDK